MSIAGTVKARPWSWDRQQWGQPTTADIAARRAGGRRHRNAEQQLAKAIRRHRLLDMMHDPTNPLGFIERGWQTRTARELGVDRATICRDMDAILGEIFGTGKVSSMGFEI